jgi:hypothetical protein
MQGIFVTIVRFAFQRYGEPQTTFANNAIGRDLAVCDCRFDNKKLVTAMDRIGEHAKGCMGDFGTPVHSERTFVVNFFATRYTKARWVRQSLHATHKSSTKFKNRYRIANKGQTFLDRYENGQARRAPIGASWTCQTRLAVQTPARHR